MKIKYRKKPVEIEAICLTKQTQNEILEWIGKDAWVVMNGIKINTLEGVHLASWGDFIIKGIKGEFYPCKPDIFEANYEVV